MIKTSLRDLSRALAFFAIPIASNTAFADVPENVANGQRQYEETCVACHGENGKGTMPGIPNFTSRKSPLKKADAVLIKNIVDGVERPNADLVMPPMGGNPDLTEQDVLDILAYMQKTFKRK